MLERENLLPTYEFFLVLYRHERRDTVGNVNAVDFDVLLLQLLLPFVDKLACMLLFGDHPHLVLGLVRANEVGESISRRILRFALYK